MLLNFILVGGLLVALGFAVRFFFSENDIARKYLVPVFLIIFFEIFFFYAFLHDHYLLKILTFFMSQGFGSFATPLLWLYTCTVLNKQVNRKYIPYYFAFPVTNVLVIIAPITIGYSMDIWVFDFYKVLVEYYDILILPQSIMDIAYLCVSISLILKYQKTVKRHYSEEESKSLTWLKNFFFGAIMVVELDIATTISELSGDQIASWNIGYVTMVGLCLLLFYLGYYGLRQKQVPVPLYVYNVDQDVEVNTADERKNVYLKKFNRQEIARYKDLLSDAMTQKKLFVKPDLILTDLADEVGLTDKQTTELLTLELDTSFYDFINQYRVEEVKTRITAGEANKLTLLAIAMESGFQSKSSFNRVFKKSTGLSPTEYKIHHT